MKIEDLRCYEGKRIQVVLKNKFHYTGFIRKFLDKGIQFEDKFGQSHTFSEDAIDIVNEVKEVESG